MVYLSIRYNMFSSENDSRLSLLFCTGGFVQIQTSQFGEMGERSQFESPVLDALSDEGCIQFQYNIAGSDNDWLNVYVEDYWSGEQTCVWHMNGSSVPNRWVAAESPILVEKGERYKVSISSIIRTKIDDMM